MSATPTKQLAVLDWLRRFPQVTLDERGHWSHHWQSEEARQHMNAVAGDMFGLPPVDDPGKGRTCNDSPPKCGRATLTGLLVRCLVSPIGAQEHRQRYGLNRLGREALVRFGALMEGFSPRLWREHESRPRAVGVTEVKRRGGLREAEGSLKFHRRMEAHHKRLADHLEASIALYQESETGKREEWRRAAEAKRRERSTA